MILKHTITDIIKQEATLKFSDVTTFSKTQYISDEPLSEEHFQIEIVYQNTRRTRLVCSETEYQSFKNGYEKYIEWLQENPSLEQSRIDMSMMDRIIKENVQFMINSSMDVNTEIQNGLVEINNKMTDKIVNQDKLLSNRADEKMAEIDKQLAQIQHAMTSISRVATLMDQFVPQAASQQIEENNKEKEILSNEVSSL